MAGHSKWSKVKHQKSSTDSIKAKTFTKLASAICLAARLGGPVPEHNMRLRFAIEQAKHANMPKANIDRAIEKGAGGTQQAFLEEAVYEALGPYEVGMIIESATDNKQRTVSFVKQVLDKSGSTLVSPGTLSYLFSRVGSILIEKRQMTDDELYDVAARIGAWDIEMYNEQALFFCDPSLLHTVYKDVEEDGYPIVSCSLSYRPERKTNVTDQQASHIRQIVENILAHDDIQEVYLSI